ncbi:MAG: thiamine diphosphokinase [Treponema sp.]|nr:thiamine diphosphokinase [Treponema sp.]
MRKQLGIVITGGEGPEPDRLGRMVNGMAEKPLLVAADSGLILAEAAGLTPDWIIGDMDSLGDESRLRAYPAERIIRYAGQKDHSDTELALALLWEKGCGETWIAGGGGGRLDHLFGIRDLFERESFPCRWITAAEDIYCIDSAANNCLSVNRTPGYTVSVFVLGGGPWKAESRGLQWPLDNVYWERGLYGLSNVAVENTITISAAQGRFMVVLEEHGDNY